MLFMLSASTALKFITVPNEGSLPGEFEFTVIY